MIRSTLIGFVLFGMLGICFSCINAGKGDSSKYIEQEEKDVVHDGSNHLLEQTLINYISSYHTELMSEFDLSVTSEIEDSFHVLSYLDAQGTTLHLVNIPRFTKSCVEGDVDQDGSTDLLVVCTWEGTGGGNLHGEDIFVFFNENNNFNQAIRWDQSTNPGYFEPKLVQNGMIAGISRRYAADDASCCPSLKFAEVYKFQDNDFVLITQKRMF